MKPIPNGLGALLRRQDWQIRRCCPSRACSETLGGEIRSLDSSTCRSLMLERVCCLPPISQHGAQSLLNRKLRLPSGMFAQLLRAPEDDLLVIRAHQVPGGANLGSNARQPHCSLQQLANPMGLGRTQVVNLTPFPLRRRHVKASYRVIDVEECAARVKVAHFYDGRL